MSDQELTRANESGSNYSINGISLANVKNKFEKIVIDTMSKVLPEFPEFDNCPICLEDVYALSLSRIPATYVSKLEYMTADSSEAENTEEIVRYAIFHVMSSPKH